MRFVADTHSLIWYLQGNERLSSSSRLLFDQRDGEGNVVIPTIVLAEMMFILRKVKMGLSFSEVFQKIEKEERFLIQPLDAPIIKRAAALEKLEIHDALIAATALVLDIPLMTTDLEIRQLKKLEVITP